MTKRPFLSRTTAATDTMSTDERNRGAADGSCGCGCCDTSALAVVSASATLKMPVSTPPPVMPTLIANPLPHG